MNSFGYPRQDHFLSVIDNIHPALAMRFLKPEPGNFVEQFLVKVSKQGEVFAGVFSRKIPDIPAISDTGKVSLCTEKLDIFLSGSSS